MTPTDPVRRDPFWRELRRRHPDVDVVVLPERPTEPPPGPPAFPAQARAVQQHASRALAALWDRLGLRPTSRSGHWWAQARPGVHRHVLRTTAADLPPDDVVPLMRDLGDALLDLGWDARPAEGSRPRIVARVAELELAAVAGTDSISVEVVSAPMTLTDETLAELEAGG